MDVTLTVEALAPQLSGIGRYTWELCQRLPSEPGIAHLRFFLNGHFVADPEPLLRGAHQKGRPKLVRWLDRRLLKRRLQSSLVHGPNYFLPPRVEAGIVTVHDLSVLRFPEMHPAERVRQFERDFERSLSRASHIITDTETVRDEIVSTLGIARDRTSAIALGVGPEFRPRTAAEIAPALAEYGLAAGGFGLCVSTLEPRKKIGELLRAWELLPRRERDTIPLVLIGGQGWLNDDLHEQIDRGAASGWLKHLGHVPEASLPAIYAGARLFAYPSAYEGFGLPPLEAMASGVPTVVAKRSCLPEVCGDAAAYVNPEDVEAFAERLAAALCDDEWRRSARERGLARASVFDWQRCAAQTAQLYQRVGAAGAPAASGRTFR